MFQLYDKPPEDLTCNQALGDATVDNCATVQLSEIRKFLISHIGTDGAAAVKPTADVSVLASWTGLIDNAAADKIRELKGMGDIPLAPESVVVANGIPHQIPKERTFNFDMAVVPKSLEDNLLRKWQRGKRAFLWPITRQGRILGGQQGIEMVLTHCEPEYPRGNEAVKVWKMKWVWYELVSPPDDASPFKVFN